MRAPSNEEEEGWFSRACLSRARVTTQHHGELARMMHHYSLSLHHCRRDVERASHAMRTRARRTYTGRGARQAASAT